MPESRVWKFPLGYRGDPTFTIQVPAGAAPLRVDFDPAGELVLWALVQPDAPQVAALVTVVGTGNTMPADPGKYVSTLVSGLLVFHAFYREAPRAD